MTLRNVAVCLGVLALVLCPAQAGIVSSLGVQDTTHTDPSVHVNASDFTAPSDAYPFDGSFIGSDVSGPNFSATWTFNYVVPALTTISAATFTVQMYDADVCTSTARNPVASFLVGTTDLTADLNTELLNDTCGTTNANRSGNINTETIILPASLFPTLLTGSVDVSLTLANVGRGVLGDTSFNGAELLYSELNLNTSANVTTPEPSTWLPILAGIGFVAGLRRRQRRQ